MSSTAKKPRNAIGSRHFAVFTLVVGLLVPALRTVAETAGEVVWDVIVEGLAAREDEDGTARFDVLTLSDSVTADEFVYSVRFENLGPQPVDGVRVTAAVPPSLHYVADSAVGPGSLALFSVDDGLTFGAPSELVVVENEQLRAAEPGDYTHIRWILAVPLESGATGFVRFRAARR